MSLPRTPIGLQALLTPAEAAAILHIDPKTVARWSDAGLLQRMRTVGGHRRYSAAQVHRLASRPRG